MYRNEDDRRGTDAKFEGFNAAKDSKD